MALSGSADSLLDTTLTKCVFLSSSCEVFLIHPSRGSSWVNQSIERMLFCHRQTAACGLTKPWQNLQTPPVNFLERTNIFICFRRQIPTQLELDKVVPNEQEVSGKPVPHGYTVLAL